jgi:dTDP-4-amino-4,6-dideoxygalactose transaminase
MVRRRTNFQLLLETFQADPALRAVATPLFPALPSRVSPLAFPVRVRGDRDRLRARLRELGVFCPVHWDLRHEPWITAFPQSRDLAATELSIPIDQRYQADDIVELARRLRLAGLESSLPGRQAWTADTTQGAGLP